MAEIYNVAQAYKTALKQQQVRESVRMATVWEFQLSQVREDMIAFGEDMARRKAEGLEVRPWRVARMERYRRLEAQAAVQLNAYAEWADPTIQGQQRAFLEAGIEQSSALLQVATDGLQVTANTFDRIPVSAVETIVGFTENGSPLDTVLKRTTNNLPAVRNALVNGIAQGQNPNVVARSMAGAFNQGLGKAIVVARTEQMRSFWESSRMQYKSAGVSKYQRLATLDDRTCVACAALHGTISTSSTLFAAHPQCRCTLLPLVPGATKPVVPDFEAWLRDQPEERQRAFFGKTRFERWQGGLPLRDFAVIKQNKIWGPVPFVKPIRDLGIGRVAPEPETVPTAVIRETRAQDRFPDDPYTDITVVNRLGGSTGAELVSTQDGTLYVRKRGSSAGQIRDEYAADELYRLMGANVPESKLYEVDGQPVKLARFIQNGTEFGQLPAAQQKKVIKTIQKDFAADALLANWDVAGLSLDNILVDENGVPWRIDNGGALRYRGMGSQKGEAFDQYATEVWTMRGKKMRPGDPEAGAARLFRDMDYYDVIDSQRRVLGQRRAILDAAPDAITKETLRLRLNEMERNVRIGDTFKVDKWSSGYTDDFTRYSVGMKRDDVSALLPSKMSEPSNRSGAMRLVDERGKVWDNLRGDDNDSYTQRVVDYINSMGGDEDIRSSWAADQADDSWADGAMIGKYYWATKRGKSYDDFFWQKGALENGKRSYNRLMGQIGEERFDITMKIQHAATYNLLDTTDLPHMDKKRGVIQLMRTENKVVTDLYKAKLGDRNIEMQRGAAESFSLTNAYYYKGEDMYVQEVPLHRVLGSYLMEREPGTGDYEGGMFAGDGENEFVAMTQGIKVDLAAVGRGREKAKWWDGPAVYGEAYKVDSNGYK